LKNSNKKNSLNSNIDTEDNELPIKAGVLFFGLSSQ